MRFAATPPNEGTLATYYRLPEECCYKLPPHISLRDATLIESLSVAVHACRLAGDMQKKSVAVFGAGPVGLLCCAIASAFGASSVVAVRGCGPGATRFRAEVRRHTHVPDGVQVYG